MTLRFSCPKCGSALSAPEDCAGRSSKCRACGQPVTVPPPKSELHHADVRYPIVENGASRIESLRLVPDSEYKRLSFEKRRNCFAVPGVESIGIITKVRSILHDCFEKGEDLRDFEHKIAKAFGNTLALSCEVLERVYRRTVMRGYTDGMLKTVEHPLVTSGFPYLSFDAVHDDRTPLTHIALEHYGLNGTKIYRRDDPFWRLFMPPLTDLCRCSVCALTTRYAAEKGVKEAQEWLRTGQPPDRPHWVEPPHFDPRLELEDEGPESLETPQEILQDVLALRECLIKELERAAGGLRGGRLPRNVLVAPTTPEEGLALLQGRIRPEYTLPPLDGYFEDLERILEYIPPWKEEPENDLEYLATINAIIACCQNALRPT